MIRNLRTKKWIKLIAALLSFVIILVAIANLMQEVQSGGTLPIDENILRQINQSSSPFWDRFYVITTDLGGFLFIAATTVLLLVYLLYRNRRYLATFVLLAITGAGLINIALKAFVGRERPNLWEQLVLETSYSFPSGHAMGSSILAMCIVLVFWHNKYRYIVATVAIMYVVVIGSSRMYLGVHYPSDIIGGWIVSGAWFMTVGAILYGHSYRRKRLNKALVQKD